MLQLDKLRIGYVSPLNSIGISIELTLGNLIVLIGRNGSGKSTLLKVLSGRLQPLSGSLSIGGQSYSNVKAKDFAKLLSIVTTDKIQVPYLKVYDLIALGRFPYLSLFQKLTAEDASIVENVLVELDIRHLSQKYISDCSDGEKQLVFLARALVQDTPLILLDEVTAHLDFVNRHRLFSYLSKIARDKNKLIIIASHELNMAVEAAGQILLWDNKNLTLYDKGTFIQGDYLTKVFKCK